jgi:hypothetical protein
MGDALATGNPAPAAQPMGFGGLGTRVATAPSPTSPLGAVHRFATELRRGDMSRLAQCFVPGSAEVAGFKRLLENPQNDEERSMKQCLESLGQPVEIVETTPWVTATNVIYTPPPSFTGLDGFTYTISDGQGGKAAAQVEVMVVSGDLPPLNHLSIQRTPAGLLLRFVGSAEGTCAWQRSTNLLNWITLSNAVVPLHGLLEFLDPDPPLPAAFYRNTWP